MVSLVMYLWQFEFHDVCNLAYVVLHYCVHTVLTQGYALCFWVYNNRTVCFEALGNGPGHTPNTRLEQQQDNSLYTIAYRSVTSDQNFGKWQWDY